MVVLEILMILVGLGAVVYSFQFAEEKKEAHKEQEESVPVDGRAEAPSIDWEAKISELRDQVEAIYQEVDDKMSQMSNEKIMGMSEYSDQVLDKIEKNHGEVVFLYDMMNSKQEEIQQLIKEIDGMKADIHDEAAGEFLKLKEQEKLLENLRREIELDSLEYQSQKEEIQEEWEALERRAMESTVPAAAEEESKEASASPENTSEQIEILDSAGDPQKNAVPDEDATASIFDVEIARIEEEEAKALLEKEEQEEKAEPSYQPLSQQEKPANHNDEIITLYKRGRSILDISKMLALGQGEVKFVIDLYNAR